MQRGKRYNCFNLDAAMRREHRPFVQAAAHTTHRMIQLRTKLPFDFFVPLSALCGSCCSKKHPGRKAEVLRGRVLIRSPLNWPRFVNILFQIANAGLCMMPTPSLIGSVAIASSSRSSLHASFRHPLTTLLRSLRRALAGTAVSNWFGCWPGSHRRNPAHSR